YQNDVDWNTAQPLQKEKFTSQSEHDALNRPIRVVAPNNNVAVANILVPAYNESGKLQTVDVFLRGSATPTRFVTNIDYNEKGQRERIDYENKTSTIYKYDDRTFRLIGLVTARNANPELFWDDKTKITQPTHADKVLQYLTYIFDPVGNINYV